MATKEPFVDPETGEKYEVIPHVGGSRAQKVLGEQFDEMGESFAKQPYHPVTTDDDKKYGPRARND